MRKLNRWDKWQTNFTEKKNHKMQKRNEDIRIQWKEIKK